MGRLKCRKPKLLCLNVLEITLLPFNHYENINKISEIHS